MTEDDPRHMLNGGGKGESGGAAEAKPRARPSSSAFDSPSFLESAFALLASAGGQEVLMNFRQGQARTASSACLEVEMRSHI